MSESVIARIRGQIFLLRQFRELDRHQLKEHINVLRQLVEELESSRLKSSPLRLALSALMQSVERGKEGIYRVLDAPLFIWSMDELTRLTEP